MKYHIKHIYNSLHGGEEHFVHYLYEALWRRELTNKHEEDRNSFLMDTYRYMEPYEVDDLRPNLSLNRLKKLEETKNSNS